VYDTLIPDKERYFSGLAASALDIPIHYVAADDHQPFERWAHPKFRRPEPDNSPLRAISVDQMSQIDAHSRVAFYCEGPDNLLHYEWRPYVDYLVHNLRFGRLTADVGRYVVSHRRLPLLRRVANRLKQPVQGSADVATLPEWLNPQFSRRMGLEERWKAWQRGPVSDHPVRPKACASLELPNWRNIFEGYDPGVTGFPTETRHPFMDLRMVRYLLSVPPIPWCADKHLIRAAMHGVLPEAVRVRPKAPLAGDPVSEYLGRHPGWQRSQPDFVRDMSAYVVEKQLRPEIDKESGGVWTNWINLRPFVLNWWLKDLRQQDKTTEDCYENRDARTYQEAL
jgi:asparagine synthase (glutamine-hydrolysing)